MKALKLKNQGIVGDHSLPCEVCAFFEGKVSRMILDFNLFLIFLLKMIGYEFMQIISILVLKNV